MSKAQRAQIDAMLRQPRPTPRNLEECAVLDVTAEVPHVFQAFAGTLDEAGQAIDRAALFLSQHLR